MRRIISGLVKQVKFHQAKGNGPPHVRFELATKDFIKGPPEARVFKIDTKATELSLFPEWGKAELLYNNYKLLEGQKVYFLEYQKDNGHWNCLRIGLTAEDLCW